MLEKGDVISDHCHQLFLPVGDRSRRDQGAWPCRRSNSFKVVDMAVTMQRTALVVQAVLCILEVPQLQFITVVRRRSHFTSDQVRAEL